MLFSTVFCGGMHGAKHKKNRISINFFDTYAVSCFSISPELYNLLSWGIEGENYEKTGENTIKLNNENGYSMQNWIFGGIKNSYILDGQDTDMMEKTEEYNNSAIVSPVLGFNPDISGLSVEIANCETVIKERMEMINLGLANPDTALPELREALKVAGADKITEELQKQIDEWWERK